MNSEQRSDAHPLRFFLPFLAPYRLLLPLLIVLGLVGFLAESLGLTLIILLLRILLGADALAAGLPGFLGRVYSAALQLVGHSSGLLAGVVLLLIVSKSFASLAYTLLTSWLRHALSHDIRARVHAQYLDLSYDYIRRRDSGEMFNILSADSWAIADSCFVLTRLTINMCGVVVFSAFVIAISPRLAMVAGAGALLVFLVVSHFGRPAKRLGEQVMLNNITLTDRMLANMQGMRAVRAFGQEAQEKARFVQASIKARASFIAIDRLYGVLGPLSEISYLLLFGLIVASSRFLHVPITVTLATVLLLYRLQPQLMELENNRLALDGHDASLRLVRGVLDPVGKSYPPQGLLSLERLGQSIHFDRVSFRYSGEAEWVLDEASFDIPARGVTAIMGESGSGKTTIVNLLLGLYEPTRGRILVDGEALREIKRADWLSRVAVAGQDAELIAGSIAENICLSRPQATIDEIRDVAAAAGALDFIDDLPDGLNSAVGDRGINLSGGQRQRIGLARALLRNPDLLILDEATNALESPLEQHILEGLRERFAGRAIVLITHRSHGPLSPDHVIHVRSPSHAD